MAEVVGVVAAAAQFAGIAIKTAKLARDLYSHTDATPVQRSIAQLETFAKVSQKIASSWDPSQPDDALTEEILRQSATTTTTIIQHLERIKVSAGDNLSGKAKKAIIAQCEASDLVELFNRLQRDQMNLLLQLKYSTHPTQKIIEDLVVLLENRLDYATAHGTDEEKFLKAIYITDPRDDMASLILRKGKRAAGTCTWITQKDAYRKWLLATGTSPALLIEGGPGKGKSMIAIFLAEQLEQLASLTTDDTVIYFFCDNRNSKQNNAAAIIRCLIWQLCRLRPPLMRHGVDELKSRGGVPDNLLGGQHSGIEALWRIFVKMLTDPSIQGTISCVIDGLDECDGDSTNLIKRKFQDLFKDNHAAWLPFRLIILSRPPQNHDHVLLRDCPSIRLDPDSDMEVNQDVTSFIQERVEHFSFTKNYSEDLKAHLVKTLKGKSGGTFLWVGFVLQELEGKPHTEVARYLKTIPIGLQGLYDRMFSRIPHEHRHQVRLMMYWICLAKHPLDVLELRGLVLVEPQQQPRMSETTDIEFYLGLVSHFITLQPVSEHLWKPYGSHRVHLIHQSIKDYLLQHRSGSNEDFAFFQEKEHAVHELLANRCLDILEYHFSLSRSQVRFPYNTASLSWSKKRAIAPDYLHLIYSAWAWPYHIRACGRSFTLPSTYLKVNEIISRTPFHRLWLDIQKFGCEIEYRSLYRHLILADTSWHSSIGFIRQAYRLQIACSLGLGAFLSRLFGATSKAKYLSLALIAKPIEVLLNGDDANCLDLLLQQYGHMALNVERQKTINSVKNFRLSLETLDTLLRHCPWLAQHQDKDGNLLIHVDKWPGEKWYSSAHIAQNRTVTKLLEAGAPVNRRNTKGWTPLHVSAYSLNTELVDTFLRYGANVADKTGDSSATALQLAASRSMPFSVETVRFLLLQNADLHAMDNRGYTALLYSIESGCYDTTKLLLAKGADPRQRFPTNMDTTIMCAIRRAWISVVCDAFFLEQISELISLLSRGGADINGQNCDGDTALHLAANKLAEIVELVDAHGNWYRKKPVDWDKARIIEFADEYRPMRRQAHLSTFREMMMQLLVNLGANEDIKNGAGRTARDILAYNVPKA